CTNCDTISPEPDSCLSCWDCEDQCGNPYAYKYPGSSLCISTPKVIGCATFHIAGCTSSRFKEILASFNIDTSETSTQVEKKTSVSICFPNKCELYEIITILKCLNIEDVVL